MHFLYMHLSPNASITSAPMCAGAGDGRIGRVEKAKEEQNQGMSLGSQLLVLCYTCWVH